MRFLLLLLLVLLLVEGNEGNGTLFQEKEEESGHSSFAARRAAQAPVGSRSLRMQGYSLSHQVQSLAEKAPKSKQNQESQISFETLLRLAEEQEQNPLKNSPNVSPFFWTVLTSCILFSVTAFVTDPMAAQSLWKSVIAKRLDTILAVAWIPWCWYNPTRFALVDLLVLIQFVRQPSVLPYLKHQVIPIWTKTFKTMLLTEIWTRIWKWVFVQVDQIKLAIAPRINQSKSQEKPESWRDGHLVWPAPQAPSWLVQFHAAVVGSVQRGIKSAFKKSIQETILSALGVWGSALQEQLVALAVSWSQ